MLMSWARRSEDLTVDKTDEKDAVIIARLAAQLRCYVPEPVDETWGRLRHLGARREQLQVEAGSQVQQMRALLECVWPAALVAAQQPFRSCTWTAAMSVLLEAAEPGDAAPRAGDAVRRSRRPWHPDAGRHRAGRARVVGPASPASRPPHRHPGGIATARLG
jgi:hypothetical protein